MEESTGATGPVPTDQNNTMLIQPTPSESLPDIIALDDLLNDVQVLIVKESEDKALLETIGNLTTFQVRPKLVEWALSGFKAGYEIHSVIVTPPQVCVDGVVRDIRQYIIYLIGKSLDDYIDTLNPKFISMNIDYAYFGNRIAIVVSKV